MNGDASSRGRTTEDGERTGDAELLRRYVEERSEGAFTELVGRHLNLVYFAALRQVGGDAHRAEEVAQTVFTDLARKAASLSRRPVLASWLHTSTRFAAAKAQRAAWRRNKYEQETENMPDFLPDVTSTAEWERLRPMIDGVIHELNEMDREAVLQRFFEGRSFADIGAALNLSEDAARMRVDRALDKLHLLLSRRGITSTGAALATALANQAVATAPAGLAASIAGSALSGAAAAGAGSLAAAIAFMSASKITVSLAVAGALAIGFTAYQSTQAGVVATELAAARGDRAALAGRVSDLEREAKAAEQEKADREAAWERARAAKASKPAPPAPVADAADEDAKQYKAFYQSLANEPELRQLRLNAARARFKAGLGQYYKSIGFTPEELEQAEESVARTADFQLAQRGVGIEPTINSANSGAIKLRLRALIGDAATDRYRYVKDRLASGMVHGLSADQFFTDEPFTKMQADRLAEIIGNNNATPVNLFGKPMTEVQQIRMATVDWSRVIQEAGRILSPTQLESLRGMAARGQQAALLVAAKRQAAGPASK